MVLPPNQDVASVFVAALFHGLHFSTLLHCLRWLIYADEGWKLRKKINWVFVTISLVLFTLSTTNISLSLHNAMVYVMNVPQKPPKITVGVAPQPTWEAIVICTNANICILIGDAVLIHRCWLIYSRSKRVIIFPFIFWLGGFVLTGLQAYWQIIQSQGREDVWRPVNMFVGPGTILTPFWASTIILNGYSTSLIAYRIWKVSKESGEAGINTVALRFVLRVLVESGFLYLAITIAHFTVWWTSDTFAIQIIATINLPITGMVFNLILMRIAQHRAKEERQERLDREEMVSTQLRFNRTAPGGNDTIKTVDLTGTFMRNGDNYAV
ncbi:hypothetical protein BDQ17DRAFT_1331410 [Cyathus striatus]|nr:hypothetical protein BDQ17DRAFT_1331410 [Cyathus striatus]